MTFFSDFWYNQKIRKAQEKIWECRWINSKNRGEFEYRQTKIWLKRPALIRLSPNFALFYSSRLDLGLYVQMLTGYNRLNNHEWKVRHEHGNNKGRFCF